MMQAPLLQRRWVRRASGAALLLLLLAIAVLALENRATATSTADELIQFNHQKHIAAGAQCVYCHPGVLNGPIATLPSLAKCMGCHQNVESRQVEGEVPLTNLGQAGIDVLVQHWEEGVPLRWEKTYDQPDFVYFTHQPHIAAGVNCENCHGNVSQMTVVQTAYRINMGFCLHCHRQQSSEKISRLFGCSTCHY
jgi:hypothetical protein